MNWEDRKKIRQHKEVRSMKYPKKIMSRPDLIKMGFSETYLRRAFATPGQTFAWQDNPKVKNSPYYYDTEAFEAWRQKDIQMQQKAVQQRVGVM